MFSIFQRQHAFDSFEGVLFTGFYPPLNEDQTLQEVPTGLDSISFGKACFYKQFYHAD